MRLPCKKRRELPAGTRLIAFIQFAPTASTRRRTSIVVVITRTRPRASADETWTEQVQVNAIAKDREMIAHAKNGAS
jgi:hypothetical protein